MNIAELPKIEIENLVNHELRDVFQITTRWDDTYEDGFETAVILASPDKIEQTILEIIFYGVMLQDISNNKLGQLFTQHKEKLQSSDVFSWYYNFNMENWNSYGLGSIDIKYFNIDGLELKNSFNEKMKKNFETYLWSHFISGEEMDVIDDNFLDIALKIGQSVGAVKESQKLEGVIEKTNQRINNSNIESNRLGNQEASFKI